VAAEAERPVRHGTRQASLAMWPVAAWVGLDATPGLVVWTRPSPDALERWDATSAVPTSTGRWPLRPDDIVVAAARQRWRVQRGEALLQPALGGAWGEVLSATPDAVGGPPSIDRCDPAWSDANAAGEATGAGGYLDRCEGDVVLRTPAGGVLDVSFVGESTGAWWVASSDPWVIVRQEGAKARMAIWDADDPSGDVRRRYELPLGGVRTLHLEGGARTPRRVEPRGYWDVDLTAPAVWQHVRWYDGTLFAVGETPVDGVASPASWRVERVLPLPDDP
jgi:hypothetical protein